jgi:glycosyltransferase involved in cell wall biosynthesis
MNVDIVIIGLNTQNTLKKNIESVLNLHYEKKNLHLYYVDGGSCDQSVPIANSFPEVTVIKLDVDFPTPGLGRNKGWQAGTSPLVQFLDSDMQMDPDFLSKAIREISNPSIGAVKGLLKEIYPDKTLFNWIGDLEWNDIPGECLIFGGAVLIRREILEKTKGYNEELVAGEDPELSLRVRELGWKIIQLGDLMCRHDLAMTTFRQYFWRAYRSGYGYATVSRIHGEKNFWKKEVRRILIRGGGFFLLGFGGFFSYGITWIPALFFLLYPRLFKTKALSKNKNLSHNEAKIYAWHCSLVVIPQFFGILRYYYGVMLGSPLYNKTLKKN